MRIAYLVVKFLYQKPDADGYLSNKNSSRILNSIKYSVSQKLAIPSKNIDKRKSKTVWNSLARTTKLMNKITNMQEENIFNHTADFEPGMGYI